jgi:GMP synthase (glutamine-hydrolysing)
MRVHYLQHEPFEGLGGLESWFLQHGARLSSTHLYRQEPLPAVEDFDWLVMMGGGMSVNDERQLPWLVAEKDFVRRAFAAEKHVLGICLGAQLIASALGARVYRNTEREIGWWPIRRDPAAAGHPLAEALPDGGDVFHWHGETFDLPAGAVRLAGSEACRNQAMAVGSHVLGLQFHLETTTESAQALIRDCAGDLRPGPYVQTADAIMDRPERFTALAGCLDRLLDALARS